MKSAVWRKVRTVVTLHSSSIASLISLASYSPWYGPICARCSRMSQDPIHSVRLSIENRPKPQRLCGSTNRVDTFPFSYFSSIEYVAVNSWTQDSKDSLTPCGHCDNCTRDPSTVENKDVTLDAWRVLQKMKALDGSRVKATMNELVEAARGLGGAGSKAKKVKVDSVSATSGGGGVDKVEMSEKVRL